MDRWVIEEKGVWTCIIKHQKCDYHLVCPVCDIPSFCGGCGEEMEVPDEKDLSL